MCVASVKRVRARFYTTASGSEPVRVWLLDLSDEDRRTIGRDIATLEFGWPIGMPTCRALGGGLYEIRSSISGRRIARVLFGFDAHYIVLAHAFIKKTRKAPHADIALARERLGDP